MEKPNFYAILPANVRYDKELKAAAKLLYAEITSLSSKYGYCTASNQYFAEVYQMSDRNIKMLIKQLSDMGYVTVVIDKDNGNSRRIFISGAVYPPSEKNFTPSEKNILTPSEKFFLTPSEKNFLYNNTRKNNTRKNKDKSEVFSDVPSKSFLDQKFHEVNIEELSDELKPIADIAVKFQILFIENLKEDGIPSKIQSDAKMKNVVEPVRLMVQHDGFSVDDLRDLYRFLKENKFWKSNVRSAGKLREKAQTLLAQYRSDVKVDSSKNLSMSELVELAKK